MLPASLELVSLVSATWVSDQVREQTAARKQGVPVAIEVVPVGFPVVLKTAWDRF